MHSERPRTRSASRVRAAVRATLDVALSFLFPDSCVACSAPLGASQRHLCASCERGLAARPGAVELPGAARLPEFAGEASFRAPNTRAFYALEFEGATRALVHALKYDGRTSLAPRLAALALPSALRACGPAPDAVTPIPLHPLRLRERGFNQSELLAVALGEAMDVPVLETLSRVRHAAPQARLSRDRRLAMPASDFRASPGGAALTRVLLVDDVVTTGATLAAASLALLRAGAGEVVCFALAGTPSRAPEDPQTPKAVDCTVCEH